MARNHTARLARLEQSRRLGLIEAHLREIESLTDAELDERIAEGRERLSALGWSVPAWEKTPDELKALIDRMRRETPSEKARKLATMTDAELEDRIAACHANLAERKSHGPQP